MEYYGIRGPALNLFESYLSNRHQFVSLDGTSSRHLQITSGVPQGSILGPVLFLIYINYVYKSSNIFQFLFFADDTTLLLTAPNFTTLMSLANVELEKISQWIIANKLSLNVSKSVYMIFRKNTKNTTSQDLKINSIQINQSSTVKYLGIQINEKLTWHNHITTIEKN